jgi:hypothetical protein
MAEFFEYGNERSGFVKAGNLLTGYVSHFQENPFTMELVGLLYSRV